jgi:hypothetical protein
MFMCVFAHSRFVENPPIGSWETNHYFFRRGSVTGGPLYLGLQRNKIMLPYPQPKRSMSSPVVVVHNYFGYDKLSRFMVTL